MSTLIDIEAANNEIFKVDIRLLRMSKVINQMIDDMGVDQCATQPIPMIAYDKSTIKHAMMWCEKHHPDQAVDKNDLYRWDEEFFRLLYENNKKDVDNLAIFANYLEISELLQQVCKKIAKEITNQTPEFVRERLNLVNDLSEEEVARIKCETEWITKQQPNA